MTSFFILKERLKGGHVTRYHTVPEIADGQDVASHTWRAMVILLAIWPQVERETILDLLYHDVPEGFTGDIPATTKWAFPKLASELSKAEDVVNHRLNITNSITKEEKEKVKVADMLELVLHCFRQMEMGNQRAFTIFMNGVVYLQDNFKDLKDWKKVQVILDELMDYGRDYNFVPESFNKQYRKMRH